MAMAEIKVPIQINLPDDWVEQIIERLRNDPEAEWVEIVRCKDCKYWDVEIPHPSENDDEEIHNCDCVIRFTKESDYCAWAERREE